MIKLRYLGHSAFYFEGRGIRALIDPFISGNNNCPVKPEEFNNINYIFVTHAHGDHLGDAVEIAKRNNATIFTNLETSGWLASKGVKVEGMQVGGRAEFPFGHVKLFPAWHGAGITTANGIAYGGIACGYIIEIDGKKIYHAGDTGLTIEMKLLEEENINIACLPIGGYYTMDYKDAARAVEFIRPEIVIPMHYNTFPTIQCDPILFADAVKRRGINDIEIKILKYGENFEF